MIGTWVLEIGLFSERSIELILPEVTSHGRAHERIEILTATGTRVKLGIADRSAHGAGIACGGGWIDIGIVARAWLVILNLGIFAVGHLGNKHTLIHRRVENFWFL